MDEKEETETKPVSVMPPRGMRSEKTRSTAEDRRTLLGDDADDSHLSNARHRKHDIASR